MKSLIQNVLFTSIISLLLSLFGCAARPVHHEDNFWGRDKLYHAASSAIIGGSVTAAALNNGADRTGAPVIGISVAVAAGAGKEWFDLKIRNTFWSWKDIFWDVAGGAAGAYIVSITY